MADISKITLPDQSEYNIKDATARTLLDGHSVGVNVPSNAVFTDTTYSLATTSTDGLLSSTDKAKLNNIDGAIYFALEDIGLTAGSATIADVWAALPTHSIIRFPRSHVTDYPSSNSGYIEVIKTGPNADLGSIYYRGRQFGNEDYRMYLTKDSNQITVPDGAWRTEQKILYYTSVAVAAQSSSGVLMRIPASGSSPIISDKTVVLECSFATMSLITSNVTWESYSDQGGGGHVEFTGTSRAATTANVVLGTMEN